MAYKRSAEAADGGAASANYRWGERPQKKLRTFTEEDVKLAKIFEGLASDDEYERLKFATELVKLCSTLYDDQNEEELADTTSSTGTARTRKTETRLLRGLCSNRKSARIGYSLALTEILRLKFGTKVLSKEPLESRITQFLREIDSATQPEQGSSSQERRDCLIGRVFAISSLVQSEVLSNRKLGDKSVLRVFEVLCALIQQSEWPWLTEECGVVCCQLVSLLSKAMPKFTAAEDVLQCLHSKGLSKTREGVAIWIEMKTQAPSTRCPLNVWYKDDPLSKKELSTLANALHSAKLESEGKNISGSRQQRPHFVWTLLLRKLIERDSESTKRNSSSEKDTLFGRFWVEAIDNKFFATTASSEKKAIGFQIFANVISTASGTALAASFSPKLMKCLINQSAQTSRYLNTAAKELLHAIVLRARIDNQAAPVIFSSLISGHGDLDFDRLTKSRTVLEIITSVEGQAQKSMLERYKNLMLRPPGIKQENADIFRQRIADQLVALIRHQDPAKSNPAEQNQQYTMITEITSIFIEFGFMTPELLKDHYEILMDLSSEVQEMFRSRLLSCLAHLTPRNAEESLAVLMSILLQLAGYSLDEIVTLVTGSSEAKDSIKRSCEMLRDSLTGRDGAKGVFQKSNITEIKRQHGWKILLGMALLQAYHGEADAVAILDELESCHNDMFSADAEDRGRASTAMIEIILSFCSQQSALNRKLAEQAFASLTTDVTREGLRSLLDVLKQKESTAGQQALFGQDGAGEVDSNNDDSDAESRGSDIELVDEAGTSASSGEEHSSDNSESENDASSHSGDSISSELADFESKLAGALKVNRPVVAANGDDDDDSQSSSDESMMDDEQMLALDSTISAMFRQRSTTDGGGVSTSDARSNTRLAHRAAKETVLAFKNRVLSLLTIYLRQQHANTLSLSTILPLLELIRTTRNAQLGSRSSALLLDTYFPAAKKRGLPIDVSLEEVLQLLTDVHQETRRWISREHVKCGSRACLFLARVALAVAEAGDGKAGGKGAMKNREAAGKKIGKLYEKFRGSENRPEWQELLWKDWQEFRRQVVDVKGLEGKPKAPLET